MKNFRPLLLEDLKVESPGLKVLRLCVNQHLPEVDWVQTHCHEFSQFLLYLSGHGVQQVDGINYSVNAGSLIYAPAGVPHAFEKRSQRIPLCLVIDIKIPEPQSVSLISGRLSAQDITLVRQRLSWLMSLAGSVSDFAMQAREAAAVLDLAGVLMTVAMGASNNRGIHPISDKLRRAISDGDLQMMTVAYLVEQVGVQKDHLNRIMKRECGLTVGQLLAQTRLKKAKVLLSETGCQVQDAGGEVGFEDRNYFARWFRKQTGLSPREWRDLNLSQE